MNNSNNIRELTDAELTEVVGGHDKNGGKAVSPTDGLVSALGSVAKAASSLANTVVNIF